MKNRTKFVNTDILKAMRTIVDSHVKYYQSDFDIDTKSIRKAALKPERTDRTFVWLCRTHGTWCLLEKNVFINGTGENSTFRFYAEQTRDVILCFIVEVTGLYGDTVTGNLYALDYKKYYEHVCKTAVSAGSIILYYEHGYKTIPPTARFDAHPDEKLGSFERFQFVPEVPEQLEMVLTNEKRTRNRFREDFEILSYELYECLASPTENGRYYGKTPIREQAETIVRKAKESGKQLFIKAVCSDGKKRHC